MHPDPRRRGLHEGVRRRARVARHAPEPHRRGHRRDHARRHRALVRAVGGSTVESSARAASLDHREPAGAAGVAGVHARPRILAAAPPPSRSPRRAPPRQGGQRARRLRHRRLHADHRPAVLRGFEEGSALAEAPPPGAAVLRAARARARRSGGVGDGVDDAVAAGAHLIAFDNGQPGATFTPAPPRSSARWPVPPAATPRGRRDSTRPPPPAAASPRGSPHRRRRARAGRRGRRCCGPDSRPSSSSRPAPGARGGAEERMRPLAASLALAAAAPASAGCGEQDAAPTRPWRPRVLRAGAERTLTLGAGSPRALPAGQPAAGWRSLYTATPSGAATTVARIDVASGRTLGSLRLPGRWTLPATVIGGAPTPPPPTGGRRPLARGRARDRVRPGRRLAAPGAAHGRAAPAASPSTRSRPTPGGCSSSSRAPVATTSCAITTLVRERANARRRDRQAGGRVADGGSTPSPVRCRGRGRGSTRCTARTRARSCTRSTPTASRCAAACPPPPAPVPPRRASGGWTLAPSNGHALCRQPGARPRRRDRLWAAEPRCPPHGADSHRRHRRGPEAGRGARWAAPCMCLPAVGFVAVDAATLKVRRTLLRGHRVERGHRRRAPTLCAERGRGGSGCDQRRGAAAHANIGAAGGVGCGGAGGGLGRPPSVRGAAVRLLPHRGKEGGGGRGHLPRSQRSRRRCPVRSPFGVQVSSAIPCGPRSNVGLPSSGGGRTDVRRPRALSRRGVLSSGGPRESSRGRPLPIRSRRRSPVRSPFGVRVSSATPCAGPPGRTSVFPPLEGVGPTFDARVSKGVAEHARSGTPQHTRA